MLAEEHITNIAQEWPKLNECMSLNRYPFVVDSLSAGLSEQERGVNMGHLLPLMVETRTIANRAVMATSINRRHAHDQGWQCWHLARTQHRNQAGSRRAGRL